MTRDVEKYGCNSIATATSTLPVPLQAPRPAAVGQSARWMVSPVDVLEAGVRLQPLSATAHIDTVWRKRKQLLPALT